MKACWCTLGGTSACRGCSNSYDYDGDARLPYDGFDFEGWLKKFKPYPGKIDTGTGTITFKIVTATDSTGRT